MKRKATEEGCNETSSRQRCEDLSRIELQTFWLQSELLGTVCTQQHTELTDDERIVFAPLYQRIPYPLKVFHGSVSELLSNTDTSVFDMVYIFRNLYEYYIMRINEGVFLLGDNHNNVEKCQNEYDHLILTKEMLQTQPTMFPTNNVSNQQCFQPTMFPTNNVSNDLDVQIESKKQELAYWKEEVVQDLKDNLAKDVLIAEQCKFFLESTYKTVHSALDQGKKEVLHQPCEHHIHCALNSLTANARFFCEAFRVKD